MTTVIAGQAATLLVEWRQYAGGPMVDVATVAVAITNVATAEVVLATTGVGVVHVATGIDSYTWTPLASLAAGDYLVTWTGVDPELDTVTATEVINLLADPAGAYTSLDAVKTQLGKITVDDRDDSIVSAIISASRMIDSGTGRWAGAYLPAAATATARTFNLMGRVWRIDALRYGVRVDDIGVDTGLTVETGVSGSGAWAPVVTFGTGPENAISLGEPISNLVLTTSSFGSIDSIRVTARWGWPSTPAEIELAARMLAARLYRRKDSPQGVIAIPEFGGIRVSRFDPDIRALLAPFMIPGFA